MAISRDSLPPKVRKAVDAQIAEQDERCAAPYVGKTGGTPKNKRPPKYHNERCYSNIIGRWFDSKWERTVADRLCRRARAGEISDLRFQVNITLLGCVRMRPDFQYIEDGELVTHEAKGFETADYVLKRKLWSIGGKTEYRISYQHKTDVVIRPAPTDDMIVLVLQQLCREGKRRVMIKVALREVLNK